MISKTAVYHKSPKGVEAIANRQSGLGPKLRSMLIMIDGKRKFDELAKVSQMVGDTEQLLTQLLDEGLIESVAPTGADPAPVTTAPAPLTPNTGKQLTLAEAQRFIARRLTDVLGPNAEELCIRIESTRNVQDLQIAVTRAEGMLRQFLGSHAVDDLMVEIHAHMPSP